MWIYLLGSFFAILWIYSFYREYLRQFKSNRSLIPQISSFALLFIYLPRWIVKGLAPTICFARHSYGPMFSFRIFGFQRRIFFLTDASARSVISRNPHLRLPARQIAQLFGVGSDISEFFAEADYNHLFASILPSPQLKQVTKQHSDYLQKCIDQYFDSGPNWTEMGLFHLCQLLVYESITSTLYGPTAASPSLVEQMKKFDENVHLLSYPSPFLWFCPDLIAARNNIANQLMSMTPTDPTSLVTSRLNSAIDHYSDEDKGKIKTGLLWAAFGNLVPALFWTYYYLRLDPKAFEHVLDEINQTSFSMDNDEDFLRSFPCLNSVIEETLRLTANPLVLRESIKDIELTIPGINVNVSLLKNDIVLLCPFILQRDEKYFPRPNEFIYDRFLVGSPNEVNTFARRVHSPFGEGKFICPGRYLGRNILKLSLIALLQQFQIEFRREKDSLTMPTMLNNRHGFGIPPPANDVSIRYRMKS